MSDSSILHSIKKDDYVDTSYIDYLRRTLTKALAIPEEYLNDQVYTPDNVEVLRTRVADTIREYMDDNNVLSAYEPGVQNITVSPNGIANVDVAMNTRTPINYVIDMGASAYAVQS